ncbi:hypothetical protein [Metabacillus malikii]|uniref:Uncharacterized protein n=1 Tax=Metabacillus malikii TaxID=1504265 RepID=A0ABT9ZK29_9BACI|nr:hypothetical protein [Metabacillus malikii]MDQ0232649.1 hypothetical protein [Metabacillus malikii]
MSRKVFGIILTIIGALAMIINVLFLKQTDTYDTVRIISYAVFIIGILFIPDYTKPKSKQKE